MRGWRVGSVVDTVGGLNPKSEIRNPKSEIMPTAIVPGSFDPVTNGHLDIIQRASELFSHVTVAVARNSAKVPLFTIEERVELLQEVCGHLANVSIGTFEG